MSFILDALKKIEEDKRRGEVRQAPDTFAMERASGAPRRRVIMMTGIAFASAALTASLLVLGRGAEDAGSAELAGEAPAEGALDINSVVPMEAFASEPTGTTTLELAAPEPEASPAPAPPRKAEAPRTTEVDTSPRPVASAPASSPPRGSMSAAEPETAEPETAEPETAEPETAEPESAEPESAEPESAEPPEPVDARVETGEEESTAAFRLVGRESPRLYGDPNVGGSAEDDPASEPVAGEASLPDDFPKFVLQGTSVINGEPVAVINDQRVFEGDSVEGARVLGIEERVVELELEGVRFKIQL